MAPLARVARDVGQALRAAAFCVALAGMACSKASGEEPDAKPPAESRRWVGTWRAAQQLTEPDNLPPPPGLAASTLRQVVRVSLGGSVLRVELSNEYGRHPLVVNAARVALSAGGDVIEPHTDRALRFAGNDSVAIAAGQTLLSDPLELELAPLDRVAVSLSFAGVPEAVTGHPGSRTTSFIAPGDHAERAALPAAVTTDHWYFLAGIDVLAPAPACAVVTLGDSITDGRGSTTNGNDRWPDVLARRLQADPRTRHVAVLNQGVGGNALLEGGLGPPALERFERDVLRQDGARFVIVLAGVNDIGTSGGGDVAARIIAGYEALVGQAHRRGSLVYGVPILPFGGSQYESAEHEAVRQRVNRWIRSSGRFDAVVDLDRAVRDPAAPERLLAAYDSGDHLHLNPAGYRRMAEAVELELFLR